MNKHRYQPMANRKQTGVTLVVSLLILVALTLLGVTSMQSTRTEISMAGNQRELGLTFNAAEAGLRAAEDFIDNSVSKNIYASPAQGLYGLADADPDYTNPATWDPGNAQESITSFLNTPAEPPKFIIKYIGDPFPNPNSGNLNIKGHGEQKPNPTVSTFRVTARGTGLSGNAHRYLQSYFGKIF